MAKEKKKSKGPKDRNSNYQMRNGNSVSRKHVDKSEASAGNIPEKSAPRSKPGPSSNFISGISSGISNATNSISKMLKR